MNCNLTIPTSPFKLFLKSISKINTSIIITVKDYKMEVLTASDGGSIILLSTLDLPQIPENNVSVTLPFIDITKLTKLAQFATEDTFVLKVEDNVIKFDGKNVNLKLHLAEQSIITVPPQVTAEKFRSFPITFTTAVSSEALSQIIKGTEFIKSASGDVKVYFYLEDSKLYGELTDYTSRASDSFKVLLSEETSGSLTGRVPIKFDNWTLLDLKNGTIRFEISEVSRKTLKANILFIRQISDYVETSYLIQPLKD
jgi:hypothetical protein